MHPLVKEYLIKKEQERRQIVLMKKNQLLDELKLFEKQYSNETSWSEEYPCWDEKQSKYYKKIPVEISDAEYAELLKYQKIGQKPSTSNTVSIIFKVFAWVVFIGGFVAGLLRAEGGFGLMLVYWCAFFVAGMLYYGFAEIIQLLNDIKNK